MPNDQNRLQLLLLLLLLCPFAQSQDLQADSDWIRESKAQVLQKFNTAIGPSLSIYTGTEYMRRSTKAIGHPFWGDGNLFPADIWYKGNTYTATPALYDLEKDKLVVEDFRKSLFIGLVKEGVDSFHISGRRFHYLADTSLDRSGVYLEALTSGNSILYAKRSKYFQAATRAEEGALPSYVADDRYYWLKSGKLEPLRSADDIIDLAGSQRDLLRTFSKSNKLNFRKNKETSFIGLISYYNQINP